MAHALLSPSSSAIWLNCAPSALMMSMMPEEETVFTEEGTLAHALAEYKVRKFILGDDTAVDPRIEKKDSITNEMEKCTNMYSDYALKIVNDYEKDGLFPEILTEITLDLSSFIPDGSGTADLIIIAGNTIRVIDFKYGAFHAVNAQRNSQMMIYALGVLERCKEYGDFENIVMTIFQPRMENISSFILQKEELEAWKKNVLEPCAIRASNGDGDLVTGSHCDFCRARLICKAQREKFMKNLEELKTMATEIGSLKEAVKKNMLSPDEIGKALSLGEGLPYWLDQLAKYALTVALDGTKIPGYKLIEKQGFAQIGEDAAAVIEKLGFNPYAEPKLKSKAMLEKEMGADVFKNEISKYLVAGEKKPALVANDKKGEEKSPEYFKTLEAKIEI